MKFTKTPITSSALVLIALVAGTNQAHAQAAAQATPLEQVKQNTEFYGFVDIGVSNANLGTTAGLNGVGSVNGTVVQQGNASRLGFRTRVDIEGDYYARVNIETRYLPDTGTNASTTTFWQGNSVAALGQKDLGEIYGGRDFSPAFWVLCSVDPTCASYVSQTGQKYVYGNWSGAAANGTDASAFRWSNMIGYKSPDWNGFKLNVSTGLGENNRDASQTATFVYDANKIYAALAYETLNSTNNMTLLAAGYDFGSFKLKGSATKVLGGANGDANATSLSAVIPTAKGRFMLMAGHLDPVGAANKNQTDMFGAGYEYNWVKNVMLYTNIGTAQQSGFTATTAIDAGVQIKF